MTRSGLVVDVVDGTATGSGNSGVHRGVGAE